MLVLFRLTHGDAGVERKTVAGLLLAALLVALMLPARLLEAWPEPWPFLFSAVHAVLFLTTLVYLLRLVQTLPRRDFSPRGPLAQVVRAADS